MLGIFGAFSFAQDAVGTHSLGKGSSSFYHTFVKNMSENCEMKKSV